MHIKSIHLLGLLALLTSIAIAGDPSVKWCDHKNPTKSKLCITEKIEWDKCKPIPDSNNKGRSSSYFYVLKISYVPF